MTSHAEALAEWLVQQHQDRAPLRAVPGDFAPESRAQAVEAQQAFVDIKAQYCGEPIGWKIEIGRAHV